MHYITNIPDDMLYSTYVHQQQERLLAEEKGRADLIKNLLNVGRSIKEIADFFKTDENEINRLLANA